MDELVQISEAFDVSINYLLTGDELFPNSDDCIFIRTKYGRYWKLSNVLIWQKANRYRFGNTHVLYTTMVTCFYKMRQQYIHIL